LIEKVEPQQFTYVPAKLPIRGEMVISKFLHIDFEANESPTNRMDSNHAPSIEGEEEIFDDDASTLPILEVDRSLERYFQNAEN